jgi:hypothetical protein
LAAAHSENVRRIRYKVTMRDFNDSQRKRVGEAIKRSHCSGNKKDKLEQLKMKQHLPAEKYPYLLLRFYDTYSIISIPRVH